MKLDKNFHISPDGRAHPLHPVRDWAYVRKLMRAARKGIELPPIYVCEGQALNGTHRGAAKYLLDEVYGEGRLIEVIELARDELDEVAEGLADAFDAGDYERINTILDK